MSGDEASGERLFPLDRALAAGGPALSFEEAPAPPAGDAWLGADERRRLAGMRFDKRRRDFRAGRWVLHRLLARELIGADAPDETTLARIDVRAGAEGAPEAFVDGRPAACRVSLSHREGGVLAAVSGARDLIGVDLEHDEPRSPAFAEEWLGPEERAVLELCEGEGWSRAVNLFWTAKEAALKALGAGLRVDPRHVVVRFAGAPPSPSAAMRVEVPGQPPFAGWSTVRGRWLASVVHRPGA